MDIIEIADPDKIRVFCYMVLPIPTYYVLRFIVDLLLIIYLPFLPPIIYYYRVFSVYTEYYYLLLRYYCYYYSLQGIVLFIIQLICFLYFELVYHIIFLAVNYYV